MTRTRTIYTLHGVQAGGLVNAGYSKVPLRALKAFTADLGDHEFPVVEGMYADLTDQFATQISPVDLKTLGMVGQMADYAADVLTYRGSCRQKIMRRVREAILRAGPGVVVLAHSMGTVVIMDVILEFIFEGRIHPQRPPETWPLRHLLTLGSPLGIDVPGFASIGYRDRAEKLTRVKALEGASDAFTDFWVNLHDADDPVTTGSLTGDPSDVVLLSDFEGYARLGVYDREVNVGFHLQGHTAYWASPITAQYLYSMVTS